jgi:uncharacterized membrane protein YhaH (DUF805 family)
MNILVESVKDAFRKYFVLEGRATRPQYWYFVLAMIIVEIIAFVLMAILGKIAAVLVTVVGIILALFWLAVIIPSITIAVRRLRDAGFSGWFVLLALVPAVGGIALIVLLCFPTKN